MKNCVLKPSVDTKKWFKAAGIRAIKTMAQVARINACDRQHLVTQHGLLWYRQRL